MCDSVLSLSLSLCDTLVSMEGYTTTTVTIFQVGSGYTMSELKDLGLKLKPFWRKFDVKRPPESVLLAKGFKVPSSATSDYSLHAIMLLPGETRFVDRTTELSNCPDQSS